MLHLAGYLEDLTVQFDKSMFFVGNEHRGSLSDGSWLSILAKKKRGLPLLEVLMISCDIIIDKPVSTIIISIVYIVIIINHDDTDTIDGGQSCRLTRAHRHKYG